MNQNLKIVLAIILILIITGMACDYGQSDIKETNVAQSVHDGRLYNGITFICKVPVYSYSHIRGEFDIAYEETWEFLIHLNPSEDSFTIDHDAYSKRTLPQVCTDHYYWRAQNGGTIPEEMTINTTFVMDLERTEACDAYGDSPASSETWIESFNMWLISNTPYFEEGWKIKVCMCFAGGWDLTDEEVEIFHDLDVCPQCNPGLMICVEE